MSTLQTQLVKKTSIIDSGDFNLSFSRYLENISENKNIVFEKIENLMSVDWGNTNLTKSSYVENGKYAAVSASGADGRINNSEYSKNKVVLSAIGANCGKVFYLNEDFTAIKNTIVFHNYKQSLNPKFLFLFLNSDNRFPKRGSGQPFISKGDVCNVKIPLPSLEIQEQIVKEIEGYQQIIDGCRQVVENYKPVIDIDPSWETSKLGEVCKFEGGTQPPKSTFINEEKDGYIRLLQIRDYKSDKNIVYIPKKERHKICSSEDIMIGRYGPPVFQILRGKSGAYNVALMKCIPDNNLITNEWLFVFLSSASVQKKIIDLSVRVRQSGVRPSDLNALIVPIPSLSVQEKIGKKLEQEREVIEGNKELIKIYEKKINDKIKELF